LYFELPILIMPASLLSTKTSSEYIEANRGNFSSCSALLEDLQPPLVALRRTTLIILQFYLQLLL
jgi:hypothetical protein